MHPTAVSLSRTCCARVLTLVLASLSFAASAAEAPPTLDKIRQSHSLTLGIRGGAKPFSTLDANGAAAGYSVDICLKVAEQLRKDLTLPELKVGKVEVNALDRFAKLKSGVVDLECGTTVNTKQRQAEVAFSYPIFIAGQKIVARNEALTKLSMLADKTVAVTRGTTADKLFAQVKANQFPGMTVVAFATNEEAFAALEAGKVAAFAGLDVVLQGMLATHKGSFTLSADSLSVEPISLTLRKDDPQFREAVDKVLATLYASGELNAIYNRWFKTDSFNLPMSALLRDSINHPSHEPGISKIGYAL